MATRHHQCSTLLLYLVVRLITFQHYVSSEQAMKRALIFGGNGFIGGETVTRLLQNGFHVTTLNRGHWGWDNEERIKKHVSNIVWNRSQDIAECSDLKELLAEGVVFDVVVDFSAYKPDKIAQALALMKDRANLYIYISSDSVYEVTYPTSGHRGLSREVDARRPESQIERDNLRKLDSYGHYKLAGEEVLINQKGEDSIPYVILRLPDVIGARDSTNRWWPYQLWIQFYDVIQRPLMVPPSVQNLMTSYVYVKDVADLIANVSDNPNALQNQIVNLALDKPKALAHIFNHIQTELDVEDVQYDVTDGESHFNLFPSVTRGAIDTSKIKELLNWTPTPWNKVIEDIVGFFKTAIGKYPAEQEEAVEFLLNHVVPPSNKQKFLKALNSEAEKNKSPVPFPIPPPPPSKKLKTEL